MTSHHPASSTPTGKRRSRSLALDVVDALTGRMTAGVLQPGDKLPTEAQIMAELGVSRTVVREALSKLQAAGRVETRHGVGTFVASAAAVPFAIGAERLDTLRDVIAVLELRIGIESEAAGLAAARRTDADVEALGHALAAFAGAGIDNAAAVAADMELHLTIARASHNPHFVEMMSHLGHALFPRSRLAMPLDPAEDRAAYLKLSAAEHDAIVSGIVDRDPEAARAAMRMHILGSRDRLRRYHEALSRK